MRALTFSPPNLPEQRASAVVLGAGWEDVLRGPLEALGLEVILCPENPLVDPRLSSHADLSFIHTGGNRCLVARPSASDGFISALIDLGLEPEICSGPSGAEYPLDAVLCAAGVGELFFHQPKICHSALLKALKGRFIPVKQGYAKCALCPITDRSVITSDPGIAAAATDAGFEVLLISPGYIKLDGFPYGFIGGAAFRLSPQLIVFTGRLDHHPDKSRIKRFLAQKGMDAVFLTDKPIFDVGSILPFAAPGSPA